LQTVALEQTTFPPFPLSAVSSKDGSTVVKAASSFIGFLLESVSETELASWVLALGYR